MRRALLLALAVAAGMVVAVPSSAGAASGGSGGFDPSKLDLKRTQLIGIGSTPISARTTPGSPRTGVSCTPLFSSVASPNRTVFNEFEDVSATSRTDVWAAGITNTGGTAVDHSMIARFNGSSWTAAPFPNVGNGDNDLVGVYAVDPNNVWTVGDYRNSSFYYNLTWHWNGSTWTRISMPQPSSVSIQELASVSGTGPNDIWAVGAYGTGGGVASTLALHWNGSSWTKITTPNASTNQINILEGVFARTPTDVWAVGYTQVGSGSPRQTLTEHYDGSSWSVVTSDNPGNNGLTQHDNVLYSVSASGAADAWAVGYLNNTAPNVDQPIAEHWNGVTWTAEPSGSYGIADNVLIDVVDLSPTNTWVYGWGRATGTSPAQPLAMHWDGVSYSILSTESPGTGDDFFIGGLVLPGNDSWAVGGGLPAAGTSEGSLIEQFQLPAPTSVSATVADGQSSVSWTAPSCDGGFTTTGYVVTAHDGCTVQGSESFNSTATTETYTGLTDDSPVYFTVAAVSAALGTETDSAASNTVIPTGTPPTALSACSSQQYFMTSPNAASFVDMDPTNLALTTTTAGAPQTAVITGNADLWTQTLGLNQDIGLFVQGGTGAYSSGAVVAWKESGGSAGTYSPNAAEVQAVIPLEASTAYTFKLQWKGNHVATGATIRAGAGPLPGGNTTYSPTRLTVRIAPTSGNTVQAVSSTQQYPLTGSDGVTWKDIDATNLSEQVSVGTDTNILITGNADLWTANSGWNQDIGINVDGTLVAWKESGGLSGTFSPNAAFVSTVFLLTAAGSPHTIKLQWKTNHAEGSARIYAGAGPWPSGTSTYSPTSLVVRVLGTAGVPGAVSTQQYPLVNSDGGGWTPMDTSNLEIATLAPVSDTAYEVSANVDLWTQNAGFNQDVAIIVSGGAYGDGTAVAWKESGGFAGTYSPNAAYVETVLHLQASTTYTIWIAWKTNRPGGGSTIRAGAGSNPYSPTRLTAIALT